MSLPYFAVSAFAPQSHLVLSHGTADFMPAETLAKVDAIDAGERDRTRDRFKFRAKAQFARFETAFYGRRPHRLTRVRDVRRSP